MKLSISGNFEVGQKVKCIKKSKMGYFGVVGEVYTVESVSLGDISVKENPKKEWLAVNRFVAYDVKKDIEKSISPKKQQAIKILEKLKKEVDKYQKMIDTMD